jgi:hypothetical protein
MDNFQTGGVHTPKSDPGEGAITTYGLDVASTGTNEKSPLDDKGNTSNAK